MTDFNKRRAEALDEVERVLDAMLLDTEAVWNESPGFVLCEALRRIRALRQNEPEPETLTWEDVEVGRLQAFLSSPDLCSRSEVLDQVTGSRSRRPDLVSLKQVEGVLKDSIQAYTSCRGRQDWPLERTLTRIRALRQNEPEGGGGDAEPEHGRMYLVLIPSIGHHGVDRSHWRIAWYRYGRWEKIEGGEFDPQPTVWRELPPTPDPAPEPEPLTWEDWGIGEKATISGPDGIATAAFKYSDDEAIAVGPHGKIWYWKFTESDAEFTIVSIDKGQEDG